MPLRSALPVFLTATVLATGAEANRPDWLCLGTDPGFMMAITGDRVTFDYLGDGEYRLSPPIPVASPRGASRHELHTSRQSIALFFERRLCRVLGAELQVTIEVAIPTSIGVRPMIGCCKPNGS